ncbi:MAG: ABC transporter ATP-binding protein [Flavobacteriaceae bacterium]
MNNRFILVDYTFTAKHLNQLGVNPSAPIFDITTIGKFAERSNRYQKNDFHIENKEQQLFSTYSSGEKKWAFFKYLLEREPEELVLINPFDSLDTERELQLKLDLQNYQTKAKITLISTEVQDCFEHIEWNKIEVYEGEKLTSFANTEALQRYSKITELKTFDLPLNKFTGEQDDIQTIFELKNIHLSYGDQAILKDINWSVEKKSFWQLIGPNGSGKSTLLSLVIGDNPKAYGQNIRIFDRPKGSGESVWDIKKKIGYFSPSSILSYPKRKSVFDMICSGFQDAIGMYRKPSDLEIQATHRWIEKMGWNSMRDRYFKHLSTGEQRLIMIIRAMIKHPSLLILDEPAVGLDAQSKSQLHQLINTYVEKSESAVIYVSHKPIGELTANDTIVLKKTTDGSISTINPPAETIL